MAPTTAWAVPVSTSALLATNVVAAADIRLTSLNEPV